MGSESILTAFQSAFPSLYSAPEETVAPDVEPGSTDTQLPVEAAGEQSTTDDPYLQKIKRITGKVSSIHVTLHDTLHVTQST